MSVVIICRNKAGCLPRVVGALARNTRRPDLLVLTDNASTDGSPEVFLRLCAEHALKGTVVPHAYEEPTYRINTFRNNGVAACPDGLIIILDADHVPARTHVEAHVAMHLAHEGGVLSTGPRLEYAYPDCSGPIHFKWGHEPFTMLQATATDPVPTWAAVLVSNMGMTRQAILSLGGFDTAYDGEPGFDDVDFTYRAWKAGYFFAADFEAYVIHVPHSSVGHEHKQRNWRIFEQKYGMKFRYPGIINMLARSSWCDYYRHLMQLHTAMTGRDELGADQMAILESNALEGLSASVLVWSLLRRATRRMRSALRRRA